jgi:dihydroxyacetone kinase
MPGFSVTLFLLPSAGDEAPLSEASLLRLLDAPNDAPGWPATSAAMNLELPSDHSVSEGRPTIRSTGPKLQAPDSAAFVDSVRRACDALIAAEPEITRMDTVAGDGEDLLVGFRRALVYDQTRAGDCGLTLKSGAEGMSCLLSDSSKLLLTWNKASWRPSQTVT